MIDDQTLRVRFEGITFDLDKNPDLPWAACYMQYQNEHVSQHETISEAIGAMRDMEDEGACASVAVVNAMTGEIVWEYHEDTIWDAWDRRDQIGAIDVDGEVRHRLPETI